MAERVDDSALIHGNGRYPWHEWLDGSTWRITQAEDFPTSNPATMRSSLYAQAARRGGKMTVRIEEGGVILFRFTPGIVGNVAAP